MTSFMVRTDLALEAREYVREGSGEIHGVICEEEVIQDTGMKVTRVVIETRNGAKAMGKPMGTYITLEAPGLAEPDEGYHREVAKELARQLCSVIPDAGCEKSVLVAGLGNRDVTADALGPHVADHLFVNRHVLLEFGCAAYNKEKMHRISCIVPGVMARTGMESAEIIKGVVEETRPDLLIAVDALAARSTRRLNRTIQLSTAGIHPGSGVGNHRNALTEESLGIPVIAVGVPTVVDAATIVGDALEQMEREAGAAARPGREHPQALSELNNMYVTGKDIDETIRRLGFTIAEAINIALDEIA